MTRLTSVDWTLWILLLVTTGITRTTDFETRCEFFDVIIVGGVVEGFTISDTNNIAAKTVRNKRNQHNESPDVVPRMTVGPQHPYHYFLSIKPYSLSRNKAPRTSPNRSEQLHSTPSAAVDEENDSPGPSGWNEPVGALSSWCRRFVSRPVRIFFWNPLQRIWKTLIYRWLPVVDSTAMVQGKGVDTSLPTDNSESMDDMGTSPTVDIAVRTVELANAARNIPFGNRWSVAATDVDLSGNWKLIVDEAFKRQYDRYLERLGQPKLVRNVAVSIVGQTTEIIQQSQQGRFLQIVGRNIRGIWNRTLVASGTDSNDDDDIFEPLLVTINSADSEQVQAEAWWEDQGTTHVSWMRGVSKYGGGSFESRRYLQWVNNTSCTGADDVYYICESTFRPNDPKQEVNRITWKFRKQKYG